MLARNAALEFAFQKLAKNFLGLRLYRTLLGLVMGLRDLTTQRPEGSENPWSQALWNLGLVMGPVRENPSSLRILMARHLAGYQ